MSRGSLYEADYDDDDEEEEDNIGEELEDLRRACIVTESKADSVGPDGSGGGSGRMPSDSENEEDFEMLRNIKSQLASSTDLDSCGGPPMGLSMPSNSESDDDFEMIRNIKSQLALSMDFCVPPMGLSDDEEDDAFETLRAIRRRFSAYENFDPERNFINDSPRKKKQVHASDNEPSSELLSRSNTCESFPDHGKSVVTMLDSEEVQAGHSIVVYEKTAIEAFDQLETCQSSLIPAASSSFPESAQAFVDAIRKNRSYKKFLRRKLTEIEALIEKNEKHIKNVKIVKDFQASCKRITKHALSHRKDPRVELISTRKSEPSESSEGDSKKTSPLTFGPSENPSVANYRMALEKYPVSVDRRNWSSEENENLAKGLKMQLQDTLLKEAIDRSSDLEGSTESISNLEITPEMIRQFLPRVNWDLLASMYIKDRSAAECEARWMSSEDPLINHGPWTVAEEKNLCLIIQDKSFTNWLDIAVSLGTNRTPFQCLTKYQRSLNADMLRREWTAEEDDRLRDAVDLFGVKDWQSVANAVGGRFGTQCSNRWNSSLNPARTTVGRWSSEENKRLTVAVTLFGAKYWKQIAQFVPGRTARQCTERWVNSLDPKLKFGEWTEEEDAKLGEATAEHGYTSWSKVASHICGRTDNQCKRRWTSLNPDLAALVRKATRLRRESIIGNFVDRESERPALVAGDLLALSEISPEPGTVAVKKKRKARQKKRDDLLAISEISLEPETETVAVKKKRKARQKKPVAECESEAFCGATERQPKRRSKRLKRCSPGDVCRQQENQSEPNNGGEVCRQENENEQNNGGEVRLLEWHNEN